MKTLKEKFGQYALGQAEMQAVKGGNETVPGATCACKQGAAYDCGIMQGLTAGTPGFRNCMRDTYASCESLDPSC